MSAPPLPSPWSPARRAAFRLVFAYVAVYCFPFPLDAIGLPWDPVDAAWHAIVPWVGAHVLHLATPAVSHPTGSGDTLYAFVKVACMAAIAVAAAIAWSFLDRRRREHARLHAWLRVYLRYVLGSVMLSYGVSKVFDLQFPFPMPDRLANPLGEASPMGLLWNFMGFSPAYQTFTGLAEVLGAALLVSRRTATLGALVLAGVLANVVMMNFCYDVPVKLGSSHLLLFAGVLLAPESARLARFFVLNRPAPPAPPGPTLPKLWQERARLALKIAFIALTLYRQAVRVETRLAGSAPAPGSLGGYYEVEEQTRDGVVVPPLLTDGDRWRTLIVYRNGYARIGAMNRKEQGLPIEDDPAKATFTLRASGAKPGEDPLGTFAYTRPEASVVLLQGTWKGAPFSARLKKMDPKETPLARRGFHWVQEEPFIR
jgi:uncharacterized membrane protein YphA (DoxX/SURF4 family)